MVFNTTRRRGTLDFAGLTAEVAGNPKRYVNFDLNFNLMLADDTISLGCYSSEGNLHMPVCSPLAYGTNPPQSGNHYPIWAAYKTYAQPFLPGFWVHNLEHGAVVLTYNCPGGCAADVARIQAFVDALPADCAGPPRRIILLPDPDLDVRVSAANAILHIGRRGQF